MAPLNVLQSFHVLLSSEFLENSKCMNERIAKSYSLRIMVNDSCCASRVRSKIARILLTKVKDSYLENVRAVPKISSSHYSVLTTSVIDKKQRQVVNISSRDVLTAHIKLISFVHVSHHSGKIMTQLSFLVDSKLFLNQQNM